MSATLISIIGPVAVGKTTLAEFLTRELPAELIREAYAENPFLAASYDGDVQARLPAQLFFLMSRAGQLSTLSWPSDGAFVSDYGFCQDAIFAMLNLATDEFEVYEKVLAGVAPLIHQPQALIHLDASNETLCGRIARRGRRYEQVITPEFLDRLRRGCEQAARGATCPVLRLDCDKVDLLDSIARAAIVDELTSVPGLSGAWR